MAQGQVGDLMFPPLMVEADQRRGGVAAVVGQGGGQPVAAGPGGAIGAGDGDVRFDDPDG